MRVAARYIKWAAFGFAAVSFVAVVRYAAMNPDSEHPPFGPSLWFVGSMFIAGIARYLESK
jgi:hypothetical protein